MPNEIRVHGKFKDDLSKPIKNVHDAWARLQRAGGQGFIAGATASATYAAFGLMQQGVAQLTSFLGDSVKAAIEEEASLKRLDAALRANIVGWDGDTAAIESANAARMALGFSDDQLRSSLTLLVAATNDVTRSLDIQRVAMDLARFKGVDLQTATQALIKVEGGRYRLLAEMGIEIQKGASREQALAAVRQAAAGQAEAFGETTAGAMEAASVAVAELQEKIGIALAPTVKEFADTVRTELIPSLEDAGDVIGEVEGVLNSTQKAFYDAGRETRRFILHVLGAEDQVYAANTALIALYQSSAEARDRVGELTATTADLTATMPSATDAVYTYGGALGTASAQAWALAAALAAVGNAEAIASVGVGVWGGVSPDIAEGIGSGERGNRRGDLTPKTGVRAFVPRPAAVSRRGGGGGASSAARAAEKAESEAREKLVREEKDALSEMEAAGNEYFDAVHDRNIRIIDDAHRVAQAQMKASHDATTKRIDDDHKAASQAIAEAQKAANAEIAIERKAVDARLAEQRRANGAGVTAAEQAQAQIENTRRERDLREALAAAQASGDSGQIRSAQEAMQSFQAQMGIESMRAAAQAADEAAEREAATAQAALDAQEESAAAEFEKQQAAEDATYTARLAAEDAAYASRQAAEEAVYAQRKKDEDARWKLVKDKFEANVQALEDSKEINTKLAQIELLRFLQEQRRVAVAEDASKFTIANIDRQIAEAMGGVPKHAGGLGFVPRDDYLAFLHRGEMVVPAGPADAIRNGRSGQSLTLASGAIQINGAGQNADQIARQVMHALERRMTQQGTSSLVRR